MEDEGVQVQVQHRIPKGRERLQDHAGSDDERRRLSGSETAIFSIYSMYGVGDSSDQDQNRTLPIEEEDGDDSARVVKASRLTQDQLEAFTFPKPTKDVRFRLPLTSPIIDTFEGEEEDEEDSVQEEYEEEGDDDEAFDIEFESPLTELVPVDMFPPTTHASKPSVVSTSSNYSNSSDILPTASRKPVKKKTDSASLYAEESELAYFDTGIMPSVPSNLLREQEMRRPDSVASHATTLESISEGAIVHVNGGGAIPARKQPVYAQDGTSSSPYDNTNGSTDTSSTTAINVNSVNHHNWTTANPRLSFQLGTTISAPVAEYYSKQNVKRIVETTGRNTCDDAQRGRTRLTLDLDLDQEKGQQPYTNQPQHSGTNPLPNASSNSLSSAHSGIGTASESVYATPLTSLPPPLPTSAPLLLPTTISQSSLNRDQPPLPSDSQALSTSREVPRPHGSTGFSGNHDEMALRNYRPRSSVIPGGPVPTLTALPQTPRKGSPAPHYNHHPQTPTSTFSTPPHHHNRDASKMTTSSARSSPVPSRSGTPVKQQAGYMQVNGYAPAQPSPSRNQQYGPTLNAANANVVQPPGRPSSRGSGHQHHDSVRSSELSHSHTILSHQSSIPSIRTDHYDDTIPVPQPSSRSHSHSPSRPTPQHPPPPPISYARSQNSSHSKQSNTRRHSRDESSSTNTSNSNHSSQQNSQYSGTSASQSQYQASLSNGYYASQGQAYAFESRPSLLREPTYPAANQSVSSTNGHGTRSANISSSTERVNSSYGEAPGTLRGCSPTSSRRPSPAPSLNRQQQAELGQENGAGISRDAHLLSVNKRNGGGGGDRNSAVNPGAPLNLNAANTFGLGIRPLSGASDANGHGNGTIDHTSSQRQRQPSSNPQHMQGSPPTMQDEQRRKLRSTPPPPSLPTPPVNFSPALKSHPSNVSLNPSLVPSLVPSFGEEFDAFHVRNTYAQLEVFGVKGDGYEDGVERTRAARTRLPSSIANSPNTSTNGTGDGSPVGSPNSNASSSQPAPHRTKSQVLADAAIADSNEKKRELHPKEIQILSSVDRYGFFTIPSHDRLILMPSQPMLKPLSTGSGADAPVAGELKSPRSLPRVPPPLPHPKEAERISKWNRMLVPNVRDEGGNVQAWRVRPSKTAKVRRRVYKGVPDRWRAAVWEVLMCAYVEGNSQQRGQRQDVDVSKSTASGTAASAGVAQAERLSRDYREAIEKPSTYDVQIDLDVPRTISGHIMFRTRYGAGQRSLFHVLHAFSLLCDACGYVQGMGPIAATLLSYLPPSLAYTSLVRLHTAYDMHTIFSPGFPGLLEAIYVQEQITKRCMPNVYESFKKHMVSTTAYATKWYITLFSNTVPFQTQLRLWDVFWLEGLDVFVAVAVAVLWVYKDQITSPHANFETILSLLSSFFVPEDEDVFLNWIEKMLGDRKLRASIRTWRLEWRQLVQSGQDATALL